MSHSAHLLRCISIGAALASISVLCAPAHAETVGLRISPRGQVLSAEGNEPASLRFTMANMDLSYNRKALDSSLTGPLSTLPLMLGLPQDTVNGRNSGMRADWYPFNSGLRTSAGLVWSDSSRRNGNAFDTGIDGTLRSRAFLGLGWTTSASSSSTGSGWRLDADLGASLSSTRDCVSPGNPCPGPASAGLKPNSGGDGIRWNPFISIGASFQY